MTTATSVLIWGNGLKVVRYSTLLHSGSLCRQATLLASPAVGGALRALQRTAVEQTCCTDWQRQTISVFLSLFRLNANNVNPAPLLMWNNVLHYSGLNPVIAGAPFVGRGGPHQLPWLQNVVVFPRISAIALDINRFPVGLGVPSNFSQSNPLFGYDQVINICPVVVRCLWPANG